MKKIFVNQVGFLPNSEKKAALNFNCDRFSVVNENDEIVYSGAVQHFGTDEISGEDIYVADFSAFNENGKYFIKAEDVASPHFMVSCHAFDKLMNDVCKCFYYLRCGNGLDKKYAKEYYHEPCHHTLATVYGEDVAPVDVCGGWHDAGDYGRYSTAGAVAVAHLLYGVRFFDNLLKVKFDIPEVNCDNGVFPDILAETKVELDFLMKMQREDGSVWHKVTTFNHAPFIMPEADNGELFLFPVSSLATADIAAVFALAYTVYKKYDDVYAAQLLDKSLKAYEWLKSHPNPLLFANAKGSNTGEYPEPEDYSNRFWAACSLFEATGEQKYYEDAVEYKELLEDYDSETTDKGYQGNVFTCFGWADVAGLGSLSIILKGNDNDLYSLATESFIEEAERLCAITATNGFSLCMAKEDFIWGSNMELLKYLMVLTISNRLSSKPEYTSAITAGLDYILGCNSMDISYVTGNGENAFKNPHLRPTAVDNIAEPWPGLVSGGPNKGLQDEQAQTIPKDTAPMKCYMDHVDCYSLNEITIYWNSPLVFSLAGLLQ